MLINTNIFPFAARNTTRKMHYNYHKNIILIIFGIFLAVPHSSFSSEPSLENSNNIIYLKPYMSYLELIPFANVDFPHVKYSKSGNKWDAMLGHRSIMFGYINKNMKSGLDLCGLIEVHNFSTDQPVPWQLWRSNFGIGIFYNPTIFRRVKTIFNIGYLHESDHAVELTGFIHTFTTYNNMYEGMLYLDYGNISAFEYIEMSSNVILPEINRFKIGITSKYQHYTPSINPGDKRELRNSVCLQLLI